MRLDIARYRSGIVALALGALLPGGGVAFALDINACGQTVPANDIGVMQVDLDCPQGIGSAVVTLEANATLDLNNHTLTGGEVGVLCNPKSRTCTVRGPGTISGASSAGISARIGVRTIVVENLTLSEHGVHAIEHLGGRNVSLKDVVLSHNQLDITPGSESLYSALNNIRKLTLENVMGTDNLGVAISAVKISGTNITLTGNHVGIFGSAVKLENSSITDNVSFGIHSYRQRVRLENSTLANNDATGDGVDLLTQGKPRLVGTTCSRSQICLKPLAGILCVPDNATWLVCANDF